MYERSRRRANYAQLIVICCAVVSAVACTHAPPSSLQGADTTALAERMGPLVVNHRPSIDTPEYYVELKPEFSQWKYAYIVASRVNGKVGYIYQNFHGFTVHTIPDSMAVKIRQMREVSAVTKSTLLKLD
jgi:hypothetical protein